MGESEQLLAVAAGVQDVAAECSQNGERRLGTQCRRQTGIPVGGAGAPRNDQQGRSFANGRQPDNRLNDYEFSSIERAGQGLGFSAQFEAAMALIGKKYLLRIPSC